MSTVIRPVGPKPPQVYWRRRLLVLALLVLLLLAVVLGVRSLFAAAAGALAGSDAGSSQAGSAGTDPAGSTADGQQGSDAEADVPADSAVETDTEADAAAGAKGDPAASGEVPECAPDQVRVAATADATAYPAEGVAKIGMTITNTGAELCSLDAGSAALEMFVVSGTDRIWSSDDCQSAAESRVTTLAPGDAGMLASSVEWPLRRSAQDCPEGLAPLRPGTYQVAARAGEITSEPVPVQVQ